MLRRDHGVITIRHGSRDARPAGQLSLQPTVAHVTSPKQKKSKNKVKVGELDVWEYSELQQSWEGFDGRDELSVESQMTE